MADNQRVIMSELGKFLKSSGVKAPKKRAKPLWQGPSMDHPQGGITFSLLSRWLSCKERFRLLVVEGLKIGEGFNHRLEYGNMWHWCEEFMAQGCTWEGPLEDYTKDLMKRYPMDKVQIIKWYNVCKVQFPVYVDYWSKHPDVTSRTPLLSESVFNVPYQLPSGRTVYLKGKWDSVDLIEKGKNAGIWLMENKTKGDIKEQQLQRQLTFDLQTMLYMVALTTYQISPKRYRLGGEGIPRGEQIKGIRYNVIRRPLSGGKGTIVQHKATKNKQAESSVDYYARLAKIIADDPAYYFMRWDVEITPKDIQTFKQQCLDPILENLCYWWDWINDKAEPITSPYVTNMWTWRHPFGVYNVLDEGGSSDLDSYLESGSEVGLTRTENLFPELQS